MTEKTSDILDPKTGLETAQKILSSKLSYYAYIYIELN